MNLLSIWEWSEHGVAICWHWRKPFPSLHFECFHEFLKEFLKETEFDWWIRPHLACPKLSGD
jgi:hypothetical protein